MRCIRIERVLQRWNIQLSMQREGIAFVVGAWPFNHLIQDQQALLRVRERPLMRIQPPANRNMCLAALGQRTHDDGPWRMGKGLRVAIEHQPPGTSLEERLAVEGALRFSGDTDAPGPPLPSTELEYHAGPNYIDPSKAGRIRRVRRLSWNY